MKSIKKGDVPQALDAWGTVANLGSTILEGECLAFGGMTFGAPDAPVSAGYFGCTQGSFQMTYPFTEQATVVEGEVELTDGHTGETTRYGVGDSWFVEKGTPVTWKVLSPRFIKHYFAVV